MKDRPILFSAPMVRALLDGSKTQTRRIVKRLEVRDGMPEPEWASLLKCCPYGVHGDRLWVRETFIQGWPTVDGIPNQFDEDGNELPIHTWYRATENGFSWSDGDWFTTENVPWKPSIHMPRLASRITLEITGVRVERLQSISEADAIAEGCTKNHNGYYWGGPHHAHGLKQMATAVGAYLDLWQSINGPGSWDANPFVWVLEFKRVEGGAV